MDIHKHHLGGFILVVAPLTALSTDLLTNGAFNNPPGDLSGWTAAGLFPEDFPTWSGSEDHTAIAGSGSALFAGNIDYYGRLEQCIVADANTVYDLSAYAKAISTIGCTIDIAMSSFASNNCSGPSINSQLNQLVGATDWTMIGIPAFDSGANAQSLRVSLHAQCSGVSTNIHANWDDVALVTDQIFQNGFDP